MVELIVVIIILGVISVSVLPKLSGMPSLRNDAWLDEVVAALRYARQTAVSHRRLVCMTVGTSSVSLQIASTYPATSCDANLRGPDGSTTFSTGISTDGSLGVYPTPENPIYFQPNGRISRDGAGTSLEERVIVTNDTTDIFISIYPEIGHVQIERY